MDWLLSALVVTACATVSLAVPHPPVSSAVPHPPNPDKIHKSFNIKGSGRISLTESMGIPVMRLTNLILRTEYCGYISIFLHSLYDRSKDGDIRVAITPDYVSIISCPNISNYKKCSRQKTVQKNIQVLACGKTSVLWLSWDSNGHVAFGHGDNIGEKKLVDHNAAVSYPVRYMYLQKADQESALFTIIYDHAYPVPDSLVLRIREDAKVKKIIHTFQPEWKCNWKGQRFLLGSRFKNFVVRGYKQLLVLVRKLDYEQEKTYTFPVRCMRAMTYVNLTVWIHVLDCNDNYPLLNQKGKLVVLEELPLGSAVGPWLKAIDRDQGDELSYRLTGQHGHYFNIANRTGEILVAHRIDRESVKFLNLSLTVQDAAGHAISANMTIRVLDVNDNQPLFRKGLHRLDLSFNHKEKLLTTFHITDKDGNGYKLKIIAGNDKKIFSLIGTQFYAKLQNLMDLNILEEQDWQFLITVRVLDRPKKGSPLYSTAYVFITVEKPVKYKTFPIIHYNFTTIEQTTSIRHETITVPENVNLVYHVVYMAHYDHADPETCGDGMGAEEYFKVDPKTGALTLKRQLNADANGCTHYKISFYLSDYRELTHIHFTALTVTVKDVNDNIPIARPLYVKTRLPCHPYPMHRVARFRFKDGDLGKANFKVTVESKNTFLYDLVPTRQGLVVAIGKKEKPWAKHFRSDVVRLKVVDGGSPHLSSVAVVAVESGCSRRARRRRKPGRQRREVDADGVSGSNGQKLKSAEEPDMRTFEDRDLTISDWLGRLSVDADADKTTANREIGRNDISGVSDDDSSRGFRWRKTGKSIKSGDVMSSSIDNVQAAYVVRGSTDEGEANDTPAYSCPTGSNTDLLILLTVLLVVSVTANISFMSLKMIKI